MENSFSNYGNHTAFLKSCEKKATESRRYPKCPYGKPKKKKKRKETQTPYNTVTVCCLVINLKSY